MTVDDQRMSKSNPATIIDPLDAARRHGVDPLRLYLVKEVVFGDDGDFSWERFDERYNSDLANNLGNLVSRVTAMAHQYRKGRLVPAGETSPRLREVSERRRGSLSTVDGRPRDHEAAASVFRLIDATNLHIARYRAVGAREGSVTGRSADAGPVRRSRGHPPRRRAAVADHAGIEPGDPASRGRDDDSLNLDRDGQWRAEGERVLAQGAPLWPRFDKKTTKEKSVSETPRTCTATTAAHVPRTRNPEPSTQNPEPRTARQRITIDDFMNVELRTAKVIAAEAVPKSKKLIKLQVDLGTSSARSWPASPKPINRNHWSAALSSSLPI